MRNQRDKLAVQVQKDNSKGYVLVFSHLVLRVFITVRAHENSSTAELEIPRQCNLYLNTGCHILVDVLIFKGPKLPIVSLTLIKGSCFPLKSCPATVEVILLDS